MAHVTQQTIDQLDAGIALERLVVGRLTCGADGYDRRREPTATIHNILDSVDATIQVRLPERQVRPCVRRRFTYPVVGASKVAAEVSVEWQRDKEAAKARWIALLKSKIRQVCR